MRFNSLGYLVFLCAALAAFWFLPVRLRRYVLLFSSLCFYGLWHWPYLALLVAAAVLNFAGARWIAEVKEAKPRRARGAIVVAANLVVLVIFKYTTWLLGLLDDGLAAVGAGGIIRVPHWLLPLGISFFLFEGLSYVIDVTRKREKPRDVVSMLVFIAFFPKLIAGPILRAKELLPQVEVEGEARVLQANDVLSGIRNIVIGLFLKVAIADGIAQHVDAAWARDPDTLSMTDAWAMAIAFGMQVYFDFSSYSRIAIGSARLFGIVLVDNFDHPYLSSSPSVFWTKWHMSLSRWIRDYVFFPLVGGRVTLGSMSRAALISMTLCGLWHGAAFTFVLWGAWHGALIAGTHVVEHFWKNKMAGGRAKRVVGTIVTFALVSIGWIFFRASSMSSALTIFARALSPWHRGRVLPGTMYLFVALLTLTVFAAPFITQAAERWSARRSWYVVEGIALGAAAGVFLVYLRGQSAFIYFQF